ncbi:head GIN domain-containing protein [Microbacterium trichothecenolyticum]|uniref:head GIN domain-containing protein n=1 Tax=Microbacterium trichothecenolyticum TaxID=69370 RepID=UPI0035BE6E4D
MNGNGCRVPGAIVIAAAVLALSGCSLMIPVGPMTSEERDIGEVSRVVLETSGDLVVSEGAPALTVRAPEGMMDRLTTDVSDGTLVLDTTPGVTMGMGDVRYDLTLPRLERIELNGSGDVEATVSADDTVQLDIDGSGDVDWSGLAADRVEVRISGSGDVTLTGSAAEISVDLEGSGNVDAEQVDAQHAAVNLSGSGEVDVSASVSLSVDLSGSGRVTYAGDPSTDVRVSGSGDVVRR